MSKFKCLALVNDINVANIILLVSLAFSCAKAEPIEGRDYCYVAISESFNCKKINLIKIENV